jgi:hypothetical protein
MDQRLEPDRTVKTSKGTWIKFIIMVLICEKIIQHTLVTLAFYHNWNNIRSSVAVNPDVLLVLGGIVALLFVLSLWGMFSGWRWVTWLLIGLGLFDMLGEFVAQGSISIVITISFLVATLLLVLTLVYHLRVKQKIGKF